MAVFSSAPCARPTLLERSVSPRHWVAAVGSPGLTRPFLGLVCAWPPCRVQRDIWWRVSWAPPGGGTVRDLPPVGAGGLGSSGRAGRVRGWDASGVAAALEGAPQGPAVSVIYHRGPDPGHRVGARQAAALNAPRFPPLHLASSAGGPSAGPRSRAGVTTSMTRRRSAPGVLSPFSCELLRQLLASVWIHRCFL